MTINLLLRIFFGYAIGVVFCGSVLMVHWGITDNVLPHESAILAFFPLSILLARWWYKIWKRMEARTRNLPVVTRNPRK